MKNERLLSLDALRGFDMFFIMGLAGLVTSLCGLFPCGLSEELAQQMRHAEWDGLFHHDTIFPLFLFLAGVSFPFSLAKSMEGGITRPQLYVKIIRRGLTLVLLGLIYNGLFNFDFDSLRCASVLGRIGLAWMFAALIFINFGVKFRTLFSVVVLVGYALLSKYVGAPDSPDADPLSMQGSLVGYIDRLFMPGRLIYDGGRFDPEGLLSTLPAIVTALLGMFTGELIRLPKDRLSGQKKTLVMLGGAAVLALVAVATKGFVPINKMLWSSTFVCAVGAYSLAMMALFYYIIDVRGWQRWAFVFRVVGMNSITIYMAQRIISFSGISKFFVSGVASLCPEGWAAIVYSVGYIAVCWLFLYFLYRHKVFLKI